MIAGNELTCVTASSVFTVASEHPANASAAIKLLAANRTEPSICNPD
jgi:hypothetical protein